MKTRSILHIFAWIVLVLLLPLSALDALMVLGGLFTMSSADCAVADNWIWLCTGPLFFLPALCMGLIVALISRAVKSRHLVWPAIIWLAAGACLFTWVQLWGKGLAREVNSAFYLSRISVPMLIAALCIWLVRIPPMGES